MGNHFMKLFVTLAISALVLFAHACACGPFLGAAVSGLAPLVNWIDCQMTAASFSWNESWSFGLF
jgi:hypothetical protein